MGCRVLRTRMKEACKEDPTSDQCDTLSRQYDACLMNERITAVLNAVKRALAARAAWEYALCRLDRGTMEECEGIHWLLPPPDGPEFREYLDALPHAERVEALGFVRELLLEHAKEFQEGPKAK